ncbi:hypothetical protein EX30DRAFT_370945 [Ascodesmis nigricans]|uniref:Uncharacterized protein n=1 Tax=Ascodesmis nigricans TaxID=341454 RepID=A0A4S2MZR6_9PEZI|nr:hypothetical protein EX30DRAFT_370945 [Ascodesmis nigricans]
MAISQPCKTLIPKPDTSRSRTKVFHSASYKLNGQYLTASLQMEAFMNTQIRSADEWNAIRAADWVSILGPAVLQALQCLFTFLSMKHDKRRLGTSGLFDRFAPGDQFEPLNYHEKVILIDALTIYETHRSSAGKMWQDMLVLPGLPGPD